MPEQWTIGDSIAAWIFLSVPAALAIGIGLIFERVRRRDSNNQ